ncbi:hypothetical protein HD553DRAFT_335503 [Filobasidium floriforme]|uniref:uncharacterized protein n=1 Tax=Filobasidium floriforme TaxID=5210 RepID=UPI001E8CCB5D|nr:uncharacterized protein HD553DRAFT_335503 [Filobasidium floriforme]KAH8084074.1 hypothetical protein HD553DRAFT_335503 [Filobasidium floriforme]
MSAEEHVQKASAHDSAGAVDPKTGNTLSHHDASGETAFEHGKEGAHNRIDGKDERSFANNIQDAKRIEKEEEEAQAAKDAIKPTDIAKSHGNEPSRGAKIDEQIEKEEEEELRRKGKI